MSILLILVQLNLMGQATKTVGGAGADYSTLKSAFDAVNSGSITGIIELQITGSTSETSSAVLNSSGTGSASYTLVVVYPTSSGLKISGSFIGTIIDLDGADNVTIDGRVNHSGNRDLVIEHTSAADNSNTTIRLKNSAQNNSIQYCIIKGSCANTSSGVISFSTSTSGAGNNNNSIDNCDVTNSGTRPTNCIYSTGSSGSDNSNNVISNNNFYDHHRINANSYGIFVGSYSTNFIISGNSFYETTDLVFSGDYNLYPIYVNMISGDGYVNITGNYIGGKQSLCGGNAFKLSGDGQIRSFSFNPIYVYQTGSTTQSNIENNVIRNISSWFSYKTNPFVGIYTYNTANVGKVNGNIIGSSTGTGSIYGKSSITASTVGLFINLFSNSAKTHYISNNTVGSITLDNAFTYVPHSFTGINIRNGTNGTNAYIENNTVGSSQTANSIISSSVFNYFELGQSVEGINTSGSSTPTFYINSNVISNLTNNSIGTNTANRILGIIAGVSSTNYEIKNNIIRDFKCAATNQSYGSTASVIGIVHLGVGTTKQDIFGNVISNLENTNTYNLSATVCVTGIYFQGPYSASTSNIYGNFIHSLKLNSNNTSNSAALVGIEIDNYTVAGGGVNTIRNIYNNVITLGSGITNGCNILGIFEENTAARTNRFYSNTVYFGGTAASHGNTAGNVACFCMYGTGSTKNIRNNILMNARTASGASQDYFAVSYGSTNNITVDNNDYYTPNTGGYLGRYNNTNINTLPIVTGQDTGSINTNPSFPNAGGINAIDYIPYTSLAGVSGTGITTDYNYVTRAATPTIGAFEKYKLWVGTLSTDFNTAGNWSPNGVPGADEIIVFSSSAINNCALDQDRTVTNIVNSNSYNLLLNGHQLTVKGSITTTGSGRIDAANSTVVFNGSSAQILPSDAFVSSQFFNLGINNSSGVTLNGNFTVTNQLTLNNGKLTLGSYNLTYSGSSAIGGTPSASNMIVATGSGEFRKTFTFASSFTFPVGDNDGTAEYSPVTLNFTSGTFSSAYAGVNLVNNKHPNNSSSTSYLNRYWSISVSGITSFSYNIALKYSAPADVVGTEGNINFGKYSNSNWLYLGAANTVDHQIEATGLTSFSSFTGGRESPLPVTLETFTSSVNSRDVKLQWTTSMENNNAGFEIERAEVRSGNLEFRKTGFISGKGTINTATNYTYTDTKLNSGKYQYRLKQIDNNGNYAYFDLANAVEVALPTKYNMSQNYPNPFNPTTKIDFEIPENTFVKIVMFDILGREVKSIMKENKQAGFYTAMLNTGDLSSGTYFYRMEAGKYIKTLKMCIIK
ncbi:MAG: T9SS type A sorting domain-containing protein [Paludibacter sp.]